MIMYENYQFANYRPGCGTLKASGGDYGGGSENLIVDNKPIGVQILQDPISEENKTPCLSAGSPTGQAALGVVPSTLCGGLHRLSVNACEAFLTVGRI